MRFFILAGLAAALGSPATAFAQCYTAREGAAYDFVPAGGTLYATDFSGDAPGDFPASLEFKEGAMEVVRWRGQPALKASSPSTFVIPLGAPLPESFTVEIGVVNRNTKQVGAETIAIYGGRSPNAGQGTVRAEYGPISWHLSGGGANAGAQFGSDDADVCIGQETTVRLKVDGDKVRFYVDERRLASVPSARFLRAPGLIVSLAGRDDMDNAVYVTRIHVAGGSGAPAIAAARPAAPAVSTAPAPSVTAATSPAAPTPTTTTTAVSPTASPAPATTGAVPLSGAGTSAATESAPVTQATLQGTQPVAIESADRLSGTVAAPLGAPTGLRAKYVGRGRFAFLWNAATGATPGLTEYEVWVKSNECANPCRVTMAGLTDTIVTSASTFDYTGPVSAQVRAVETGRDPSPASVPVALPPIPRYKGVYRVAVTGLRVNRETIDNPAEIDGKRDEVLVRAWANTYAAGGALVGSAAVESKVHGDRNADAWSLANSPTVRIKAGSASLLGGLRTGDEHRAQAGTAPNTVSFPLLVWEGSLRESEEQLVVVPTVWEVDRAPAWQPVPLPEPERELLQAIGQYAAARFVPAATQEVQLTTEYLARLRQLYGLALSDAPDWALTAALRAQAMRAISLLPREGVPADSVDDVLLREAARIRTELGDMGGPEAAAVSQYAPGAAQQLLKIYAAWAPTLAALMNNADRPIGIYSRDGAQQFDAQMIRLDFAGAERIVAGAHGGPPGELAVRYVDKVLGANGDYTLFLRVERLQ
ncbi:MAG: hypothetical protein ACM357_01780 [Gemmatimonadota bacterium]